MIHLHNIVQGSTEWFEKKLGKLSASNATAIGANGAGLKTYCKEIAQNIIGVTDESYTNGDIQRGNDLEPIARAAYEFEFGVTVKEVGGITNDDYVNVWVSPDGLIGNDGGVEIKARNNKKHFALITGDEKEIPFNQIQMTILISGRKWWDFVSFNPKYSKPLFVKRIYPDLIYHEKLKKGFAEGNKLIPKYVKQYNTFKNILNK
jgi:hypothetical protein